MPHTRGSAPALATPFDLPARRRAEARGDTFAAARRFAEPRAAEGAAARRRGGAGECTCCPKTVITRAEWPKRLLLLALGAGPTVLLRARLRCAVLRVRACGRASADLLGHGQVVLQCR